MSYAIQEIFQSFYEDFAAMNSVSYEASKVANSISNCRTSALGGNACVCEECGYIQVRYNSCGSRSCPCCQTIPKEKWIDKRKSEVVDAPYFHVVFTVPEELNPLIYSNKKLLYNLLYQSSAATLKELASDSKYLGARIGFLSVLHTWGQNLSYHPHVHAVVLGGGLTTDLQFKQCEKSFLFPVRVVSKLFRGKFMEELKLLYQNKKLSFSENHAKYHNSYEFQELVNLLYSKEWIPHLKETFYGADKVIEYLGRYTHRIAISNSRILTIDSKGITFRLKDYRTGEHTTMTLEPKEFIRRFLMHVLPCGFVKIRYYGLLANRHKRKQLAICRNLLKGLYQKPRLEGKSCVEILFELFGVNVNLCPYCNIQSMKPYLTYHRRQ